MTILTRAAKGSELTYSELDANLVDTRDALAASSGSSLVGYLPTGANSLIHTIYDQLIDLKSAFDVMTVSEIADIKARTKIIGVGSKLQKFINDASNSTHKNYRIPAGTYYCDTDLYIIYDATNNPNFNSSPLKGGGLLFAGDGRMHRRDFANDTHIGTVIVFADGKRLIASDSGTTKTWGNKLANLSIIGNVANNLVDARWCPTYTQYDNLFVANISNNSAATSLITGDTWQSTFSNIETIGDKSLATASAGKGFVFSPDTSGGGNNLFYNITSAFFSEGNVFGTDYNVTNDIPSMFSSNNQIINCQGQYCGYGTRIKHRINQSVLQGYWGELNTIADLKINHSAGRIELKSGKYNSAGSIGSIELGDTTGTAGIDACSNITCEAAWLYCGTTQAVYKHAAAKDILFKKNDVLSYGTGRFIATPIADIGGEVTLENNNYKPVAGVSEMSTTKRYVQLDTGVYTDVAYKAKQLDYVYDFLTGSYDMTTWRSIPAVMRCNTVSGDVTILLPTGLSAFPERVVKTTISKFQSANSVIIDAGTGKVIRGAQTLKLSSAESCLELTHGQAASTRWDITGSQSTTTNTLTLSAAVTTTKADTSILTGSKIMLTPTNVAAANLMLGTKSLYVSAKTAGTSFAVTTADGTAAAGTETFDYVIVN